MAKLTCILPTCDQDRAKKRRGYCLEHGAAFPAPRQHNPVPEVCVMDDCGRPGYARDWCRKHYGNWLSHGDPRGLLKLTVEERFWSRVDKQPGDGCWLWTGPRLPANYGVFAPPSQDGRKGTNRYVHRLSYEWLVGPIPDGYQIDHLCHSSDKTCQLLNDCPHRLCVRPDHLEAVTPEVNSHRAHGGTDTHCKRGHPYDGTIQKGKWRICRVCQQASQARYWDRRRAEDPRVDANGKRLYCKRGHEFTPENTVRNGKYRLCRTCRDASLAKRLKGGRVYALKSHCIRGHEYTEENTRINPNGTRTCRACIRSRRAEAKERPAA